MVQLAWDLLAMPIKKVFSLEPGEVTDDMKKKKKKQQIKQMHSEEGSWKLSLLAEVMALNSNQWRMKSYILTGFKPTMKWKKSETDSCKNSLWDKGEWMVSNRVSNSL